MSEMVERVAKAMYVERIGEDESYLGPWDGLDAEQQDIYQKLARAAIKAMREPTEAMIDAGRQADNGEDRYLGEAGARECWQQMIDEALR